jgi:hypothetical protein
MTIFKTSQEIRIACMKELAQRRINGDQFNFEEHIKNNYNKFPKLDFKTAKLNLAELSIGLKNVINKRNS